MPKTVGMNTVLYGGLDPSYTGTACVVIDADGNLVERVQICAPKKQFLSHAARLVYLREQILEFFVPHRPSLVAVEAYSHGSKFGREAAGELGGLLRVGLWEIGINYANVAIPTLKAFVAGKGNADKAIMMREVFRKWNYEADNDNDCDAFGLAQIAMKLCSPSETWTKRFTSLCSKVEIVETELHHLEVYARQAEYRGGGQMEW